MATLESTTLLHRRRSLRRAVRLTAEVGSTLWAEPVTLPVTNLSAHGLWLESDLPLAIGAAISLRFVPPGWSTPIPFACQGAIAWVSLGRRRSDVGRPAGMGVHFTGISATTRQGLERALCGLPPPLPTREELAESVLSQIRLELEDGSSCLLQAEAALLSIAAPVRSVRREPDPAIAKLIELMRTTVSEAPRALPTSALMSAIFAPQRARPEADRQTDYARELDFAAE
jgi:hypothetical protein